MKIYLLFVGGSGMRAAKSFVHMCASGCFGEEKDEYKVMLIDTDKDNGDTELLMNTIAAYNAVNAKSHMFPEIDFFKEKEGGNIVVWNPLQDDAKASMSEILRVSMWNDNEEGCKMVELYDFMYTKGSGKDKGEQNTSLEKGFYGHTSIGSYFMTGAIRGEKEKTLNEDWERFFNGVGRDDAIFVMGSMFGGTGASAIPTIAKILKNATLTENVKIGCGVIMPYYTTVADGDRVEDINSQLFPVKNKASLAHYADQGICNDFDHIYFVGEDKGNFMKVKNCNGGDGQRNKAHYVEIYSVLTIADFIRDLKEDIHNQIKTYDIEYNGDNNRSVEILNSLAGGKDYARKLITFFNLSVLFNKAVSFDIVERDTKWAGKCKIQTEEISNLRIYCKTFTDWLYEIAIETGLDGTFKSVEENLMGSHLPERSSFDIIKLDTHNKLNLLTTEKYKKPKGWFSDRYAELEALKSFSNDPKVRAMTGKEIYDELDKSFKEDITQLVILTDKIKSIITAI